MDIHPQIPNQHNAYVIVKYTFSNRQQNRSAFKIYEARYTPNILYDKPELVRVIALFHIFLEHPLYS